MKVLVVDDESTILETLQIKLRKEGHSVFTAVTAEEGMKIFKQVKPDICLLDVMLPNRSGFDLCRAIRKDSEVPVIFLTARGSESDRIAGFDLGADDYIVKPFNLAEVAARVRAVLRRATADVDDEPVECAGVRIDPKSHQAWVEDKVLELSPREFNLLHFFMRHPGQAFTRDALIDRVWGADAFVDSRTVDVHIRWLRQHIEEDPANPSRILTVRGVGYKFTN